MADIYGQDGQNDTLAGGVFGQSPTDDRLFGGTGNDTYTFTQFSGFDRVTDTGGTDRILFDATVTADRVRLDVASFGGELFITVVDDLENIVSQITIEDHFSGQAVETLAFADGTTINLLAGLTIQGAVGNTDLYGTAQADTLIGSVRDESLYGGIGNDTYRLAADFGTDVIADAGGTDLLQLTGVSVGQVSLVRQSSFSNTLAVQLRDAGGTVTDQVLLANYFATGSGKVETLRIGNQTFDIAAQLAGPVTTDRADTIGTFLGNTLIDARGGDDRITDLSGSNTVLGGAGDDRILTGIGNDVLSGGGGKDRLTAGDGNDRLDGGAGADVLTGGRGADDFVFARGTGRDRITDFGTGADMIVLNDNLWRGTLTAAQVVNRHAEDTGADVVLDFGRRGEIVIEGLANTRGLADLIEIV